MLGVVTALCVPCAAIFLFCLYWVFPARNGYPVCDPSYQPWCAYDPTVTVRWVLGVVSAAVAALCLVAARVLRPRVRLWWPWALAPLVLLLTGIVLLTSIFGG